MIVKYNNGMCNAKVEFDTHIFLHAKFLAFAFRIIPHNMGTLPSYVLYLAAIFSTM